jgi:ubiquinone/menaquinone biosynthesis C-methylase UbiE
MAATVDTWDGRASRSDLYAVLTNRWSPAQCIEVDRRQRRALAAALPPLTGSRVMDLGCGIGRITGWLAGGAALGLTHDGPGATPAAPSQVIGIDFSGNMLARAAREVRHANVGFVHACAQHLPFASEMLDLVVTVSVLQHMSAEDEFRQTCAEAARTLRPGGVLVCLEGAAVAVGSDAATRSDADTRSAAESGTGTVQRGLDQLGEAFASWLVLDRSRRLRCIEDEYAVSRWTRKEMQQRDCRGSPVPTGRAS